MSRMPIADWRVATADCGLSIADWRLPIYRGLRIADWIADCELDYGLASRAIVGDDAAMK
jgi:hypothetical protein